MVEKTIKALRAILRAGVEWDEAMNAFQTDQHIAGGLAGTPQESENPLTI